MPPMSQECPLSFLKESSWPEPGSPSWQTPGEASAYPDLVVWLVGGEGRADRCCFETVASAGYSWRVPGGQPEPDLYCTLGRAGNGGGHHHLQGVAGHAGVRHALQGPAVHSNIPVSYSSSAWSAVCPGCWLHVAGQGQSAGVCTDIMVICFLKGVLHQENLTKVTHEETSALWSCLDLF